MIIYVAHITVRIMKKIAFLASAVACLVLSSCGAFGDAVASKDATPQYESQPRSTETIVQYPNVDNKPTYSGTTRPNITHTVAPQRPSK